MRVYIAGPYQANVSDIHNIPRVCQHNVDRAIEAFHRLIEEGHQPLVPHLSHYLHIHQSSKQDYGAEFWYEFDFSFLDHWAEAIYMLCGWQDSRGAVLEHKRAKKLGLTIMYETVPVCVNIPCSLSRDGICIHPIDGFYDTCNIKVTESQDEQKEV